jgi:ubiquinol-cytochrome c reductase iron-sulfur subunit
VTDDSTNAGRRRFLVGSTSVVGAAGVAGAAVPSVMIMEPMIRFSANLVMLMARVQ